MTSSNKIISAKDFSEDFIWGVATSAPQIEGAYNVDGRGLSTWDVFAKRSGKIKDKSNLNHACNFYYRYKDDLLIAKGLGFKVFRFSISWSRILPDGTGKVNQAGIKFYHNLIDECLQLGLTPYVTLFHWDLPYTLQKEGGWTSHFIVKWFSKFVKLCCKEYGNKVKNWMVINEPMSFTALGYMLGIHAPGKKGLNNFFPAVFNTAMAQAEGGRIIRDIVDNANIGTTFSCSEIKPYTNSELDIAAANKMDILINRLFIEPTLGLGFPNDGFALMDKLNFTTKAWRYIEKMQFDFDFIGVQNYFPITVKHSSIIPIINAMEVKPSKRKVPQNGLGWEINADSFYNIIRKIAAYHNVKNIIVTENGACFNDKIVNGVVNDTERINYFNTHLTALHKLHKEEPKLKGYFAWTLLDNFEWSEGYKARFGLVYVDFITQLRTIKQSGYWWRDFLKK
ncbi:MAG: GH1 family beta-glucosidase [Bacteroidetes bacterium]|nr:GH1 family beta-glucosidase [Bacteroidota bacterium]